MISKFSFENNKMDFAFKVIKSVGQYFFMPKPKPGIKPKQVLHQLTSLPKYVLVLIAHNLSVVDLYRFSTVNHQAYARLCGNQDYWKLRAQTMTGKIPEMEFDRNVYLENFCSFQKIDGASNQFFVKDISGNFRQVCYTRKYKATIDFRDTLCVKRIPDMPLGFRKDNDCGLQWRRWPNAMMVKVKSIICRDDYILIQTRDQKLYVQGRHPFTKPDRSSSFYSPTLLVENVTRVRNGKYNTIIWKDGKIYQTNVSQYEFGQYIPNTTFEPIDISSNQVLPFSLGDIVYLKESGARWSLSQLYFRNGYGREPPGFISANVRNIYVQEPYVYWISVKGVLWQANLIEGTPKRRIMERVHKLSCGDESLWVLTLDSKLYHIQSNSLKTDLTDVRLVSDNVCQAESHDNFVVVKR